jgi:hypothetical protein
MKNVKLIFVLLLCVNCTTDFSEIEESLDLQPQTQNCIDDLPKVRLTNNGTHSFDFIIYDQDFNVLHESSISSTTDSGWIELTSNDVIAVVTNDIVYGQKVQFSLVPCDNKVLQINASNTLIVPGG